MHYSRALQILALREVLAEDQSADFQIRSIFRWYSKTFHTPLHVVYTLPEFDVLQAFYEEHYEELNSSNEGQTHIHKLLQDLCKTDEELAKERLDQDKEDVFEYQEKKFVEQHNKDVDFTNKDAKQAIAKQKLERDKKAAKELEQLANKDALGAKLGVEDTQLAPILEAIENIEMDFSKLDLGELADMDTNSLLGVK